MVFRITEGEHVSDHIWLDPNAFKTPLIIGPPRESSPNMDAFYDGAQAACDWRAFSLAPIFALAQWTCRCDSGGAPSAIGLPRAFGSWWKAEIDCHSSGCC